VTAVLKTVPASATPASWTCNLEAEQAVLGGLFLDNAALDNVADLIGHEDFYTLEHREIFRTIVELIRNMKPADTVTVFDRMRLKDPDRFGDEHLKYLVSLAVNTPSAANVRRYAEIVRERAIARALFSAGIEISNAVREPGGSTIEDLVDQAQERVLAVDQQRSRAGSAFQTLDHLLPEVVSFVDR
jgi:replicative DNA helicase